MERSGHDHSVTSHAPASRGSGIRNQRQCPACSPRRSLFPVLLLLIAAGPLFGVERIAVVDFLVHSDNPKYSYLGKGISEMLAVELSKSPEMELVEREKRVELMREVKFVLSGLADETQKQVRVGRMLAADYLVFGEIVDMTPQLLISVRVTAVETGRVVYREKLTESPGRYDYISGYFAASILRHFDARVAPSTEKKRTERAAKNEEAVVAFSRALEAYDREAKEEAREELQRARRIDPDYEAAKLYLQKLESVSPKFRVETDYYAPTINPAYLGMLDQDMLYLWSGASFDPPSADEVQFQKVGDYNFKEYPNTNRFGYYLPLGRRLGVGIEYVTSTITNWIDAPFGYDVDGTSLTSSDSSKNAFTEHGAALSGGLRLTESLGMGVRLHGAYSTPESGETINVAKEGLRYGGAIGFLWSISGGRSLIDLQLAYDSKEDWYLDEDATALRRGSLPLVLDGSLIFSLLDKRLITALKGIGDLYTDARGGHALRAIPMVEYWLLPYLSLRGGYEYVHLQQSGSFTLGHGFLAGATVKLGRATLNLNYSLRKKPSRQVPGYLIEDSYLLLGLTYSPGWMSRH